jgi:acyl-CoA synthetase (NDP forming)
MRWRLEGKMARTNRTVEDINNIFNAKSIAVVGASDDLNKFGGMTMNTIIKGGYQGRIYPVNPKADTVQGLRAYPSIDQIPAKLDAVVVVVPARFTPDIVRQAAGKGAKGAIVMSAGFREAGNHDLEDELLAVARKHEIRLLGPNIQGINYLPNKLCAIFFPVIDMRGPIAVVSQSGSITTVLCEWAVDEGFGISAAVNLGNQTDICESDYIEFFAQDEKTKATVIYLESIKNGRNFINTLKKSSNKKPVCIYKAGRTEVGARTAASHTGSMTGSYDAFQAACRQYGAIVAGDLETLYDQAKGLATIGDLTGRRIAIISSSGGANSVAVDEAEILGLKISAFPKELVDGLKTLDLLPLAKLDNPVDLGSVWGEHYRNVGLMIDRYDAADMILMNFADPVKNTFEIVSELAKSVSIPVAVSFMGGGEEEKVNRFKMQRSNIPVFSSPARAMRGIQAVVWHSEYRRSREGGAPEI